MVVVAFGFEQKRRDEGQKRAVNVGAGKQSARRVHHKRLQLRQPNRAIEQSRHAQSPDCQGAPRDGFGLALAPVEDQVDKDPRRDQKIAAPLDQFGERGLAFFAADAARRDATRDGGRMERRNHHRENQRPARQRRPPQPFQARI